MLILFSIQIHAQQWNELNGIGSAQPQSKIPIPKENGIAFSTTNKCYYGTGCYTGLIDQQFFSQMNVYDPSSDTWDTIANFPIPRASSISFSINGIGYVGLGNDDTNGFNDLWKYDTLGNAWIQLASLPSVGISEASCFVLNNKAYVVTGRDSAFNYSNACWEYNPTLNVWIQKNNFPGIKRTGAFGMNINGKGYVGLGTDSMYNYLIDLWEYDDINDSWIQKTNYSGSPSSKYFNFTLNNKGFIHTTYNEFWQYDPSLNLWSQKTNIQDTIINYATGFSNLNNGYVLYSNNYSTPGGTILLKYNEATDIWSTDINNSLIGNWWNTSITIGSKGYNGNDIYDASTDQWLTDTLNTSWLFSINGLGYGIRNSLFQSYDPLTNLFSIKAPLGFAYATQLFSIGNKGYCVVLDTTTFVRQVWEYDTQTDNWQMKNPLPTDSYDFACFSIGGTGYIGSGWDDNIGWSTTTFYSYDPIQDLWTQKPDLPFNSREFALGLGTSTKGYIGFGDVATAQSSAVLGDIYEYDPVFETWRALPSLSPRNAAVGFIINDQVYCGGGRIPSSYFPYEYYDFYSLDTSTSTAISNIPFEAVSFLVYPNPTSGSLKIDYSLKNKSIIKIELFNILGDKIKIIAEELKDAGKYSTQSDLNFPAGMYFLKLQVGDTSSIKKILLE